MTFHADGDMSAANPHANAWWEWELLPGRKKMEEGVLAQTDYETSL